MDEIAIGQMRYNTSVLNLVLVFLHVHTSRPVVVCIRNVCSHYVMTLQERWRFVGRCLSHVGAGIRKQASWTQRKLLLAMKDSLILKVVLGYYHVRTHVYE